VREECKLNEKGCETHFTNKQCEFSIAVKILHVVITSCWKMVCR
jgi:hypothetical protein